MTDRIVEVRGNRLKRVYYTLNGNSQPNISVFFRFLLFFKTELTFTN
jgi:hypothetical protein